MERKEKIYNTTTFNNERALTRRVLKSAFGNKNKTIKRNKQTTPFRESVNDFKKIKEPTVYASSDYIKFKKLKSTNQKILDRIVVTEEPFNPTITFASISPSDIITLIGNGTLYWNNGVSETFGPGRNNYSVRSHELRIVSNDITFIFAIGSQSNISKINVSKLPTLTDLDLSVKQKNITELDVTKNINLVNLLLGDTNITQLNISKNINLERLTLNNTKITALDITNNSKLVELNLNNITTFINTQQQINDIVMHLANFQKLYGILHITGIPGLNTQTIPLFNMTELIDTLKWKIFNIQIIPITTIAEQSPINKNIYILKKNLTVNKNEGLIIDNGLTLQIDENKTVINSGGITVNNGTISNSGSIINKATINNTDGTFTNNIGSSFDNENGIMNNSGGTFTQNSVNFIGPKIGLFYNGNDDNINNNNNDLTCKSGTINGDGLKYLTNVYLSCPS